MNRADWLYDLLYRVSPSVLRVCAYEVAAVKGRPQSPKTTELQTRPPGKSFECLFRNHQHNCYRHHLSLAAISQLNIQ